jgi:6-phosphofructokinase 2
MLLDSSGAPLRRALAAGVFLVKPNHIEFRDLIGAARSDWSSMARVGKRLRDSGQAEAVIVTRGSKGALAILPEGSWRLQAPEVTVESMVGAGDSLIGALVLNLARGRTLLDACRIGVAASAAAVETPGTELAQRAETLRLAKRTKVWAVGTRRG